MKPIKFEMLTFLPAWKKFTNSFWTLNWKPQFSFAKPFHSASVSQNETPLKAFSLTNKIRNFHLLTRPKQILQIVFYFVFCFFFFSSSFVLFFLKGSGVGEKGTWEGVLVGVGWIQNKPIKFEILSPWPSQKKFYLLKHSTYKKNS